MCGIAGTVGMEDSTACAAMIERLTHRGPDDSGFRVFPTEDVALGFRRLSIIDLSPRANQPMSNEDGTVWVIFNGEIYNYVELRSVLLQRGHRFRTNSDTETLLHSYEEYGEHFVEHLNGMFALALLDTKAGRLYLVRDRLGIKPLYYWVNGARIAFASEIKAILEIPAVEREVNWQGIYDYLTYLYVPGPSTAFRDIYEVPAGHMMTIDLRSRKHRTDMYWHAGETDDGHASADPADELRHLLSDAVRMQMVSDVPLGIFLSGGIDSTVLTGLACEWAGNPIKTFTVVFHGADLRFYSEHARARSVAERYGTEHHEIPVSADDPTEMLGLLHQMDQPFGNPTYYLTHLVSKLARPHVTVGLTGAGGDELFAGYPRYRAMELARSYSRLPRHLRAAFASMLSRVTDDYRSMRIRRMREFVEGINPDPVRQFVNFTYFMAEVDKQTLIGPGFPRQQLLPSDRVVRERFDRSSLDGANKFLDVDLGTFLPWNILDYTDKMSMAVSLEARVPFLDHRVVDFSSRIPFEKKLNGAKSKVMLREACADLLPQDVRRAPKRGFNLPLALWMRDRLDSYFDINMSRSQTEQLAIFRWDRLMQLRDQHRRGKRDNSSELFAVIAFDIWYRRTILREDVEPLVGLPRGSVAKASR